MANSLIDFGDVARTGIALQNLEQAQRRNDIYERSAQANEQQNLLEAQRLKQSGAFRIFDELEKLSSHPSMALNLDQQVEFTLMKGKVLEQGLGVRMPLPSADELRGGYKQIQTLLQKMRDGTPDEKSQALLNASIANPTWAMSFIDTAKKAGELSTQMEEINTRVELNKSRLEALNIKNGRYTQQQNFYTEHMAALGRVTGLAGDPQFAKQFQEIIGFQKPEARQAYLALHPEFKREFERKINAEKQSMGFVDPDYAVGGEVMAPRLIDALQTEVDARKQAVLDAQAKSADGQAPIELAEELSGYGAVMKARQIEAEWLADPYNKAKWKALKKSEQDLRILSGVAGKKISEVTDARLALSQEKFDVQTKGKLKSQELNRLFIEKINAGESENQAYQHAIEEADKMFKGVPFDSLTVQNPEKKGRLSVGVTMGREDVSRQLKVIEGSQSVIDFTADLIERIEANPKIVGPGAQLGAAVSGSVQQFRALMGADPGASKFFDTQIRDEAEGLHGILVYMQARSIDPVGALNKEAVTDAREIVGPLSSFSTGPTQLLNKMKLIRSTAERNLRRARKRLRSGTDAYLSDDPDVQNKPVGELSEEELLKELLRGKLND